MAAGPKTPETPCADHSADRRDPLGQGADPGGSVAGRHPGFGIPIRWPVAAEDDTRVTDEEAEQHSGQNHPAAPDVAGQRRQGQPLSSEAEQAARKVEMAAVRLLARREHSSQELRRKLKARGHDDQQVLDVLSGLERRRLQSDERFTSSYVDHHARRGQGPVRIRAQLRQQGIAEAQIEQQFVAAALDWVQLAAQVRQRKFGVGLPRAASERAKQARFLQYRGFNSDQIRAALDFDPAGDVEP